MAFQHQGVPWWTFDFGRALRQNFSRMRLNSTQVMLVHVLLDGLADARSPTVKELATPLGITSMAVRKHLQVLEELGYVRREHRSGPNIYYFDGLVRAVAAVSEHSDRH
jgi:DNA-binding transcriptional ArsR family regulator